MHQTCLKRRFRLPYRVDMTPVLALTTDDAKTIAIVAASVFVLLGLLAAWVMKTVVQKVVAAVILAGLALVAWSQRSAVDQCVQDVRASLSTDTGQVTCTFFGTDVDVPVSVTP